MLEAESGFVDVVRIQVDVDAGAPVCVLGREVLRKLECDESVVGEMVALVMSAS